MMDNRLKADIFSSAGVCWTDCCMRSVLPSDQKVLGKIGFPLCFSHSIMIHFVFIFSWLRLILVIYSWATSSRQKCRLCQSYAIMITVLLRGRPSLLFLQHWISIPADQLCKASGALFQSLSWRSLFQISEVLYVSVQGDDEVWQDTMMCVASCCSYCWKKEQNADIDLTFSVVVAETDPHLIVWGLIDCTISLLKMLIIWINSACVLATYFMNHCTDFIETFKN